MSNETLSSTAQLATDFAKRKIMDLISIREHSEKELRDKLQDKLAAKEFSTSDTQNGIETAIEFAKSQKWLRAPQELAQRFSGQLHQRYKGILFINAALRDKGLPEIDRDSALELEKALTIVKNRYDEIHELDDNEIAKIGRFLIARGFESETVRKVLNEKL